MDMVKTLKQYDFIDWIVKGRDGIGFLIGGQSYIIKGDFQKALHKTKYYAGKTEILSLIKLFKNEEEIVAFFDGMDFGKNFDFN